VSSPDWRVRDVTRPKRGGARSGEGGRTSLQEGGRESYEASACGLLWSWCGSSKRVCVFLRIARGCLRADRPNGEKGSSKLGISFGTERLPFPTPSAPKTPSELSGARRELRAARARCPTPEGLEAAVAKRDDASREVATSVFLWGFV